MLKKYGSIKTPMFFEWAKLERKFEKVEIECEMRSTSWYVLFIGTSNPKICFEYSYTNDLRLFELEKKKFNIHMNYEFLMSPEFVLCIKNGKIHVFYFDSDWIWQGLICNAHHCSLFKEEIEKIKNICWRKLCLKNSLIHLIHSLSIDSHSTC